VPRLTYLTSARRDLAKIAGDIEDASQNRSVAETFIGKMIDYCEHLARLPGLLGQARHELRPEYRSVTFGSYVIFFRYTGGESSCEIIEIIHVVHGARDSKAFFGGTGGASN
jgi:toxin ParE1/3/4